MLALGQFAEVSFGSWPCENVFTQPGSSTDGKEARPTGATSRPVNPRCGPALALWPTFRCVPKADMRIVDQCAPRLEALYCGFGLSEEWK
jgi:hypothetical protein